MYNISNKILYVSITFNALLIASCIYEKNYNRVIYWIGALMINLAVLNGMK